MNLNLQKFWIVFRKEWRDALRDRRSLRMAFLPPVYFAAIFVASVLFVIHIKSSASASLNAPIPLPVSGGQYLPDLLDWLEERGIAVSPVMGDAVAQVTQKKLDYALLIPAEAEQQFAQGQPATLWLLYDATNSKTQGATGFIRQQLWGWNGRIGSLRLLARGIAPSVANPIQVRDMNIASDEKMGVFVMGSLPLFLVLLAFIGSVGFSADMTAGERERRSLEALLITPAQSFAIIGGKWLTSLLITLLVLALAVVLLMPAFALVPFDELGLRVDVSPLDLLAILLLLVPLAVFAVALQVSIALFARSFKDAQTYIGLMVFIPMIPLFYTLINPGVFAPWFYWVPVLGQQAAIKDLLTGADLSWQVLGQFCLVALPVAGGLLWFAARQLRRPAIVYGF